MSSELAHQPCQNSATYTEYGLHVFERTYLSAGFLLNFFTEGTTKPKIAGNFVTGPSRWGCGCVYLHWGPGAEPWWGSRGRSPRELLGFQQFKVSFDMSHGTDKLLL